MTVVYLVHTCTACKKIHVGFVDHKRAVDFLEKEGTAKVKISSVDPSIRVEYSKFLRMICE